MPGCSIDIWLVIHSSEPLTVHSPCFRCFMVDTYRCSREGGCEAWLHLTAVKCVCGLCRHHHVAVAESWMMTSGVCALARNMPLCALSLCDYLASCDHLQDRNKVKHTALLPTKRLQSPPSPFWIPHLFKICLHWCLSNVVMLLKGFTLIDGTDNRPYIVRYACSHVFWLVSNDKPRIILNLNGIHFVRNRYLRNLTYDTWCVGLFKVHLITALQ
jgi:hypothetical protein